MNFEFLTSGRFGKIGRQAFSIQSSEFNRCIILYFKKEIRKFEIDGFRPGLPSAPPF